MVLGRRRLLVVVSLCVAWPGCSDEAKDLRADPAAPELLEPSSAHDAALRDAADFGLIGRVNPSGTPVAPTAPWGRDDSVPSGNGRLGSVITRNPPKLRMGATSVSGRLMPEVIQRIVRQNFGRFRLCYEAGLRSNPNLAGTVSVTFIIGKDGAVSSVTGGGDLPDEAVVSCVAKAFNGLMFPQPEGGVVRVTYPIIFSPGDGAPPSSTTVGGKALASVTWEDVKKALEKEGCTDFEKLREDSQHVVMKAKKDGRVVNALLAIGAPSRFTAVRTELQDFESRGAVFKEERFLLAIAIEGDTDKSAAKKLLDALISK